jgi:protein TonB
MIENQQEKKNKRIALATTIGVHALLLLLFMFVIAWRAPDPPLPEYGIELNFGLDNVGTGSVQPEEPAGSQQPSQDEVEEVNNDEPEQEEVETSEPAKPQEAQPQEQPVVTSKESPVAIKEEKKPDPQPVEKPKEKEQKEVVKTETKPTETAQKTTQTTAEKTTTDNKEGKPVSHGDDTNKTGDKGDPKGELDNKALYGNQGGGNNGAGLDLAGWNWDFIPKPNVPNNETGRVVFEIKVDDSGEIISIRTVERSVSLEAENICRKEVEKLTFSKTGTNVPAISTGRITFVIRSN